MGLAFLLLGGSDLHCMGGGRRTNGLFEIPPPRFLAVSHPRTTHLPLAFFRLVGLETRPGVPLAAAAAAAGGVGNAFVGVRSAGLQEAQKRR